MKTLPEFSGKLLLFCIALFLASCDQKKAPDTSTSPHDSVEAHAKGPESARPAHWGYEGEIGPAHWSSLSAVYAACAEGKSQSPIDLIGSTDASVSFSLDYKSTSLKIAHHMHVHEILDNGHTIQVTVDEGSTLALNGVTYHLKQFHFHSPSEHTSDGKHVPLEMHWVHQSEDGKLAVVSGMFQEGAANEDLQVIIDHFPASPGDTAHHNDVKLNLNAHLPKDRSAFHYSGSLTTPPCTEQVEWLVFSQKFTLSKAQAEAFASRLKNNNRPVQPLNGRVVSKAKIS